MYILNMSKNRIYCLGDGIGFVEVVDKMQNDAALKVVNSARISYAKKKEEFDESDKKLISYLLNHDHLSPFRHSYYTFYIKFPLFVSRQHMKYQVGSTWRTYEVDEKTVSMKVFDLFFDTDKSTSWNEISGRYAQLKPEFYIPQKMRGNIAHGNKQASTELDKNFPHEVEAKKMLEECEEAYKRYEERLENGIAKEIARMFLPQNIYTECYWTVSLQGVMHFLQQRLKPDAQYEIQRIANAVYSLVASDFSRLGISKNDLIS